MGFLVAVEVKEILNSALLYHQEGDLVTAEEMYLVALEVAPQNVDALNLLGLLNIQNKDFKSAINYLKRATTLRPCAYFYENLGIAYFNFKDYSSSITCYQKALLYSPNDFDILFRLGLAYKNINNIDDSIIIYEKAIKANPLNPLTYFNLANIYERKNETQKALFYYNKAKDLKINYKGIDYFLAACHLKLKNFEKGWSYYEHRPSKEFSILSQTLVYKKQMQEKPLWNGEDLTNKTIFVYYDSALGDTIMFARYLPELVKRAKKVLFKPQVCFMEMFKNNNFGTEIIDTYTHPDEVIFDYHVPIMSIPYILKNKKEEDIPMPEGYFKPDSKKELEYKEKYFKNRKIKVGIKWQGNPAYNKERIIPLSKFYNLFGIKNVQLYSLQKGDGEEELENLPDEANIINIGATFTDFSDTAAAISNLDLVICNDTSIAHLAGALGKRCWVLLPFVQNWRWHNDLTYSPWYNSIKLFKQTEPNEWEAVLRTVYKELLIFHI